MVQLLFVLRLTGPRCQYLAMPHAPQEGISMVWAPETSGWPGESRGTKFHQMPSFAATYRVHPLKIHQLLLALRLTGYRCQFLAVPTCFLGSITYTAGVQGTLGLSGDVTIVSPNAVRCRKVVGASVDDPAAFGSKTHMPPKSILGGTSMLPVTAFAQHGPQALRGTWRIPGDPVSPNAVRCRNVQVASVDDPAAFRHKAHRPPRCILRRARILSGMAFARHGHWRLRQDPENPQGSSFTKYRPLPQLTGCICG